MKFYDTLIRQNEMLDKMGQLDAVSKAQNEALLDPDLKRIIFGTEQAVVFAGMDILPPTHGMQAVRMPFHSFYLEFTEPFEIGHTYKAVESENNNLLRGLTITSAAHTGDLGYEADLVQVQMFLASDEFLTNPNAAGNYRDSRIFWLHILTGEPYCSVYSLRANSAEKIGDAFDYVKPSERMKTFIPVTDGLAEGDAWMENIKAYGAFVEWVLCYLCAKSISIKPEPLTRQQRRALERKGAPNPWHIIQADQTTAAWNGNGSNGNTSAGGRLKVRHDVQGHFRFNRHKLKDGTYKHTIEFVRPHLRGLKNSLYVPATRKYNEQRLTINAPWYW